MKKLLPSFPVLLLAMANAGAAQSAWAYIGTNGTLAYETWGNGNQIMDFSGAGYLGGGVAIPTNVTVHAILNPSGGDDTAQIQNAINSVAGLTPNSSGIRGAVLLSPGTFTVSSQINISASGVVVWGSGSGTGGTTIVMTNASAFTLFNLAGSGSPAESAQVNITDSYVPSGTTTFHVSNAAGFSVGDTVIIGRTVTSNWVNYLEMEPGEEIATNENWISAGSVITTDRQIKQISGNQITLDVPLTDSFDTNYLGIPVGTLSKYTWSGRISQVGLEHLSVVAPATNEPYTSVSVGNVIDSWARDINIHDGVNCFTVQNTAKRFTVDTVNIYHSIVITGDPPADFTVTGTQILINNCQTFGTGVWPFVTQGEGTGPIVALNFYTSEDGGISPHQRWTTGILADNGLLPNAPSGTQGIAWRNRGGDGSGQGWATGWSVAWNVTTPYFLNSVAPGTENWCIGGTGEETSTSDSNGIYDQTGTMVTPQSLYLEQLKERLGPAAVQNIGYQIYTMSTVPAVQSAIPGENVGITVNVAGTNSFSDTIGLSVANLPAGVSAQFSANSIAGSGAATLTLSVSNSTALGNYPLTINGVDGNLTNSATVNLAVGNYALSATPASQFFVAGATNISYTVTLATNASFGGSVALGLSGLPTPASAVFSPPVLNGAGPATLTIATATNTPPGSYPLTITGANGNVVAGTMVLLAVGTTGPTSLTWDGGSANSSDWSDGANWGGGVIVPRDTLFFGGGSRLLSTNDSATGTVYTNLVFNPGAGAFALDGNPVKLAGNITNNSSSEQTVNLGLSFATNTVLNGAAGPLIVDGGLTNTSSISALTLTLAGAGVLGNLLHSANYPGGGTNVMAMNNSSAAWTLLDNATSTPMTVPWVFTINAGTFNFGSTASAPSLASTVMNGEPQDFLVGTLVGATGTFNMYNGSLTTLARLDTGAENSGATGNVNIYGGTLTVGSQVQMDNVAGGTSVFTVSGGMVNAGTAANPTAPFFVASRGTGTLTLNGGSVNCGTLDCSRGIELPTAGVVGLNTGATLTVNEISTATANTGSPVTGASAHFNFNGGTLKAAESTSTFITDSSAGASLAIPLTVTVKAGGAIINDNGHTISILEALKHDPNLGFTNDGGLTKLGAGTLTLAAATGLGGAITNTYNGPTVVSAGTLILGNAASVANSTSITVTTGATINAGSGTLTLTAGQILCGGGSVTGSLDAGPGGVVAPAGGSRTTARLTVSGNITLQGNTVMNLNPAAATNDVLHGTGSIIYGGQLILTNISSAPFAAGQSFTLFTASSYSGAFTALSPIFPGINLAWNTNNLTRGILSVIASPTPPPKFNLAHWSGHNLVLQGANGVPDWPYYVLTTSNLTLPASQWPCVATDYFDASGNFNVTNPVGTNSIQQFYLLELQ
jgi:autotransporter-associated beta strand protein